MTSLAGSATFRLFSYGAFIFFAVHVLVQWLLTKLTGPYGKKSAVHEESPDHKSTEALEVKKVGGGEDNVDDGFKEIDLKS